MDRRRTTDRRRHMLATCRQVADSVVSQKGHDRPHVADTCWHVADMSPCRHFETILPTRHRRHFQLSHWRTYFTIVRRCVWWQETIAGMIVAMFDDDRDAIGCCDTCFRFWSEATGQDPWGHKNVPRGEKVERLEKNEANFFLKKKSLTTRLNFFPLQIFGSARTFQAIKIKKAIYLAVGNVLFLHEIRRKSSRSP